MKIVNKIKHTLNTGKPIDSQKFLLSFQDYKVVSFDIFDTTYSYYVCVRFDTA